MTWWSKLVAIIRSSVFEMAASNGVATCVMVYVPIPALFEVRMPSYASEVRSRNLTKVNTVYRQR